MRSWTSPDVPALPGQGPRLRLFDTASGTTLPSRTEEPATLYVCGITPYDATHLGHASTYVGFDLLVRAWRDAGRTVTYVQNVTDVDDPLLERARETGVDWRALADEQVELYRSDMTGLRVLAPDHLVGAVEAMDLVAAAVEEMVDQGVAYPVPVPAEELAALPDDGAAAAADAPGDPAADTYADLSQDPFFGTAAHLDAAEMVAVFADNGGDPDRPGKRSALDPLLWRRARRDEPHWPGRSLGPGRAGWHIECAAIARHYLGPVVEVQGGGRDLVFPHHEMSESHLRALTRFDAPVLVHAHGGMVACGGQKMSKSLGNLVLVSDLVRQGVDPMAIRLALLDHHYRSDWQYSAERLRWQRDRLRRWRQAVRAPRGPAAETLLAEVRAALADDLDSPAALRAVDGWVERALADGDGGEEVGPRLARRTLDALLGIAL
ncbi:cysteine--1-D-myo-inosityl 2-amino-2-deoxy-alpha-D-glucopyranoside ligase [Georgenia sp. TF02-10]|uniref:cysteine--1-D-myo-inosityl 2-amino-2-deoxy-alpha-D-glucopyranoside ligase n=1 Tax=Georgenia sp. TF02-10 TaxID=2917725 RepID=UPI001FA6AB45|nr:cysteine--1-D-myo-inosityl 2-amino-2-deoxy-alpha-D-glucopyranoside ligase [Georgenia sp. TF02-10]UNX56130.1 cysteine--1-D-myo-inosityl 2-amino-2-deoxy-alpha-D-glucopyranoside ligase [Georgenia sp. TF02-10]